MRFTSLIIELIRARPRLVVWLVVLLQAALWLILPLVLYRSPPGDVATVLAFGREYQVGTDLGPPLAFWLADIAFRAAGNHMFGVYLLAQICSVVTFLDAVPAGARHRRRTAGGARRAAVADRHGIQFARPRIRPAGAGASALGAAAAALLAADRAGPPQRLVRLVDRSRTVAADHFRRHRPVAAGRGVCARNRARPAHADVVRSVVRAAGDRGAGAAVSDLADPRRHPGAAAMACYRGFERQGRCTARRCSAACWWRFPASCCWRCSTPAGSPASRKRRRSSFGRRSIPWRATSFISLRWRRRSQAA